MCSGNADRERVRQENKAKKQQREYERQAREREAQLAQLAAERQTIADQQAARLSQLNTQRDDAIAAAQANQNVIQDQASQRRTALRNTRDQEVARANQLRLEAIATEEAMMKQMGESRAAGSAVSSSLRALSNAGKEQGKTASVSKKREKPRGSRQTTASLSIGSTRSGGGSGSNLSI